MHLTHLNPLRALEAALRHGSFTSAAEELGITPAAVGQRIRILEQYLGRELFLRSPQGIKPTEDSAKLREELGESFATIASVLEKLKAGTTRNRISVTLPASFAENWLTPLISKFYQRHLEVDLRLDASNRDVNLQVEDFDFAIRYGLPVEEPLQETILFGDNVLPVCSPEFAASYNLNANTRSLEDVPLIHLINRTGDPGWVGFNGWGKKFEFAPDHLNHGVRYSRISSGLQSAVTGQGLVLCGLTEAFNEISKSRLVTPFGPSKRCPTHYEYRLIWIRGKELSPLQENFIVWILEKASEFRAQVSDLLAEN